MAETQLADMEKDICILLNDKDEVIGKASKKDCHKNTAIAQGMLHRAFSVFLFNSKGELMLQRVRFGWSLCWL